MKPRTISTLEGIFELDASGFYKPHVEPERKAKWGGPFLWAIAITGAVGISGCLVMAWRALGA